MNVPHAKSNPSLRRLDTLMSCDEFMGISDFHGPFSTHEADEAQGGLFAQISTIDLDLAFASPETVAERLDERRICEPPLSATVESVEDDGVAANANEADEVGAPLKRQPRALSSRLWAFGRRARDSISDWTFKRSLAIDEHHEALIGADVEIANSASDSSVALGDRPHAIDSVSPSISGLAYKSGIDAMDVVDPREMGLQDEIDPFFDVASLYTGSDTRRLAAEITRTVHAAFEDIDFMERDRSRRFANAVGNNTTEAEQWKASAEHVQAVLKRRAAVDDAYQRGVECEAISDNDDDFDLNSEALIPYL